MAKRKNTEAPVIDTELPVEVSETPPAPPPITQLVHVAFYWEAGEGNFGFDRKLITGVPDIRLAAQLDGFEQIIRSENPAWTKVKVISWQRLEG